MYDRAITRHLQKTKLSVLLLGPRQVGKSTLMNTMPVDLKFDLADEGLFLELSKDLDRFKRRIIAARREQAPYTVLVDEIQRIPALLNTVQHLIDSEKLRFLLTGSTARKLKGKDTNLLPGRIIREFLTPLTVAELASGFELDYALRMGMLPWVWDQRAGAEERLESYAEVYLREEIRAESVVRNIGDFARFLDVAAFSSGSWLNYSKLASDTEIPKETIRRFFALLVETLLVYRLENFRPKSRSSRKVPQRERFIFFDIGVRNSLLKSHRYPISPELRGSMFEQWFILQVLYLKSIHKNLLDVCASIDSNGNEVDLVIELPDNLLAVEIKSGNKVNERQCRALLNFTEAYRKYKPVQPILCYTGSVTERFDNGVIAKPYQDVLIEIASEATSK